MIDDRRKEIILGQSCNMALEMLKYKGYNPDEKDTFRPKFKDYAKFFYELNIEVNDEILAQKTPENVPVGKSVSETKPKKAFSGSKKPCPKCSEMIPSGFSKHFACGWGDK